MTTKGVKRKKGQGYPKEWKLKALEIKEKAGWKCERCGVPHGPCPAVLTVHHLDEVKSNLEDWNLAALCQVCHLVIQGRVAFMQDYVFEHTPWMLKHVQGYNKWASHNGKQLLTERAGNSPTQGSAPEP